MYHGHSTCQACGIAIYAGKQMAYKHCVTLTFNDIELINVNIIAFT